MSPRLLQFLATIGALSLSTTAAAVVAVLIVPRHSRALASPPPPHLARARLTPRSIPVIPTLIHVLAAAALLGAVAFGRLSAVVLRTGRFEDRAQLAWLIVAGAGAVLCALQASAAALAVLRGS